MFSGGCGKRPVAWNGLIWNNILDVDHDELIRYVREMFSLLPRGQSADASQQKYHGGEVHKHTANGLTYASLVSEGAG